jgi:RNA polymerase sigma-70 factor (ECF subfamily)
MNMSDSATPSAIAGLLEHSTWVRRLARTLVRDEALADDLAQETWLVALRHPPEDGRPPRPWLSEVMRNLVRMRVRGERRRAAREQAMQAESESQVDARQLVEQVETQRMLAGLVVTLEEPYRTTILLRYHEGLSAADIAARQKVPPGTVRWRLKQGLDRLRVELDQRHGGERARWQLAMAPLAKIPSGSGAAAMTTVIKGVSTMNAVLSVFVVVVAGTGTAIWATRRPAAAPAPAVATATPGAPTAASGGGATPRTAAALPRLDKKTRAQMLQRIEQAQPRTPAASSTVATGGIPAGPGELDAAYIRERIAEIVPLVKECYENAQREQPALSGKLVVDFTIVGDPDVGALVSESAINDERSTIMNPGMRECVQETMYAAQFRPPLANGEVKVVYPFVFMPAPKP